MRAEVKRFGLFHHDPEHGDSVMDGLISRLQELLEQKDTNMRLFAASEGREIVL